MSEWKKVKLGDYIDVLSGFAYKSKDFSDSGIPVINRRQPEMYPVSF